MKFKTLAQRNAERMNSPLSFKGEALPISDAPNNVRAVPMTAPKSYIPWTENKEFKAQEAELNKRSSELSRYSKYFERAEELSKRSPILRQAQMKALNSQYGISDEESFNRFVGDYAALVSDTERLVKKYNLAAENEATRYKLWQSSLRPYAEVQSDIDALDSETFELERQRSENLKNNMVNDGMFKSPTLQNSVLTEEGKKANAEIASKLEDAKKRRESLQQEKKDSQNYYYSTLKDREDFSKNNGRDAFGKMPKNPVYSDREPTAMSYATDEELEIYHYLFNTEGSKAAGDYASFMSDTWNRRKAGEKVAKTEALPAVFEQLSKAKQSFGAGVERFGQGVYSTITGKTTNTTAQQFAKQTYREKSNAIGKAIYDLSESIGNMAPGILLSAVTGSPTAGLVSIGASSGGNAYNEARKNGASKADAYAYGTLVGMSEAILGKALGGISSLGGGKIGTAVAAKLNAADKAFLAVAGKLAVNGISEGVEEGLQTILEPIFATMVLDEKYKPAQFSDVAYSALLGFLSAGFLEGGNTTAEYFNAPLDRKVIDKYISDGEKAAENSLERAIADDIKSKLAANPNARITGFDVGRIARYYKDTRKAEKKANKELKKTLIETAENETTSPTPAEAPVTPQPEEQLTEFEEAIPINDNTPDVTPEPVTNKPVTPSEPTAKITPTVSRDGIEIKPETDPEIQARVANAKDEIERTGILSGASDTTINTVRRLSKLLKTDIRFEIVSQIAGKDGETYDQNGRYDRDDGIIYINMGSGTNTYTQIIAHEFTHSVEGTKLYTLLEKYAKENYKPQPGKTDFDAEAVKILKRYRAANKDYDMPKAQAEVVSNYVAEQLLNNEANIERLVKENRTLAEKLKDIIDKVISVIGSEKAKAEAQTRVKLARMSKLLNEALKTRDSNTDKSSNIKTRYNELVRKLQNDEITEEAYESQLSKLDSEASAMGIDLMNMGKDGESYSLIGIHKDGKKIYKSNFPKGTPKEAKSNKILSLIQDVWSKKPIRLIISNGETSRTIFAKFDPTVDETKNTPTDASKIAGGNRHGNHTEQRVTLDLADDYYQIAVDSTYNYSKIETGKSLDTHEAVNVWHYFVEDIYFVEDDSDELVPYTVTINVKEKDGGDYVYSYNAEKEPPTRRTLHADVNTYKGANGELFLDDSISQPNKKVNSKNDTGSYSITPSKTSEESTDNSTSEETVEKGKQILDHVRRNPKQERITKLFQKAYDNSKKKVVEHRLPRNSYVRMRDAEILLTREIADAFSTPFKRNGEYYHVIRDLVGEYVSTGKITQATLQEVARFLKVNFGVKITSSSMDILKYRIHKVVESDLKFVRETYEYMLEQANAEPVEVKQSRLEKGYRVVERRIHDFRKWLIDEMSINENQFADIDELIYKMLSHSENGVIPSAYLNEFFNKIIYYTKHEKSKSVVELIDWLKRNFHIASSNKEALSEMTRIVLTTAQDGKLSDSNITSFLNAVYSAGEVRSADVDLHLFFKNAKMSVDQHTIDRILESNEYDEFALSMLGDAGEGISVSDMYDYLHALRPELFPNDIFTEQEQAEYILSVAQESKPSNVSLDDTLSQEEKERLFKRANSKVSEVVSKFEGKKYSEIRSSINAYAVDLARDVMFATNYATDTASLTQAAMVESMDTETDKIEALYEKLKAERKKALSARGKTILRDKDQKALRALLSGEKKIEELSSDYNVKDIKTVYEASVEYERLKEQIGKYKEEVLRKRYEKADKILGDADISTGFRDHSAGMLYMMNTPERNIEWIGSRSVTSKNMIDAFIKPVHEAVRKMTIEKNDIVKKINDLDLSRKTAEGNTDSEAFAVQFVGEAEEAIRYLKRPMHNKERKGGLTLEEWEVLLNSFWLDNPNMDKDKIRKSIKVFREVYQKLFDEMNATRVRNGYEPVDYRGGYFPHFNPEAKDGLLSNFGKILGIDPKSDILPTEINGLTHIFRPNIPYMSSANARSENLQFETTYDAVEGMHRYLDSVLRVIHLTDSIGDLRALAQQIRYRASDEGRRESENMIRFRTDLDETQRQAAIDRIYEGGKYKLSNFVVDLEEYTNLLAGKKSKLDRTPEWAFGRGIYKLGKWISSRISANMIVANLSSALTNFIPLTIAISELPSEYIIRAASTAVAARHSDDGIESMSTFITNRKGADDLLKQWQLTRASSKFIEEHKNIAKLLNKAEPAFGKFTEIGMKPMELIDLGVSNVIVRAYYLYNVDQGMSETEALEAADDKARRIMADRSIGSMPTVFGATNPLVKLFTQFQLEVANQIAYFTHDVMQSDIPKADRDKKAKEIAIALIRYCIAAWLFNDLYEKLTGRRPALDPLGVFNDAVGDATGVHVPNLIDVIAYATNPIVEELFSTKSYYRDVPPWITQKMPFDNAVSNFTVEVLQETPFVGSLFGGGRLPAANALPDVGGALKTVISSATPQQKLKKVGDELSTVGTYFVLPGGGGQISKTVKGIAAVAKSGKYTKDSKGREQLQYPITPSLFSVPKTLLFGPSSTSRGQEWIRTNFQNTLSWKETKAYDAMVDEGVTQDEAYDVVLDISNAGSKDIDKISALNNADIPDAVKRVAYEQLFLSGRSVREATLNALDNLGPYRDVVIDFMLEHPEASSQEEIMNIWGDKFKSGRIIEGETSLSKREKAAILQTVVGNKTNPYWPELKESVYYVVHPDVKLEDEEKKRKS